MDGVNEALACGGQIAPKGAWPGLEAVLEFLDPSKIFEMGEAKNLKFDVWMEYANDKLSSKGAWPGSHYQFLNFGTPSLSLE